MGVPQHISFQISTNWHDFIFVYFNFISFCSAFSIFFSFSHVFWNLLPQKGISEIIHMFVMLFSISWVWFDESFKNGPLFHNPFICRKRILMVVFNELAKWCDQWVYFLFAVLWNTLPIHSIWFYFINCLRDSHS